MVAVDEHAGALGADGHLERAEPSRRRDQLGDDAVERLHLCAAVDGEKRRDLRRHGFLLDVDQAQDKAHMVIEQRRGAEQDVIHTDDLTELDAAWRRRHVTGQAEALGRRDQQVAGLLVLQVKAALLTQPGAQAEVEPLGVVELQAPYDQGQDAERPAWRRGRWCRCDGGRDVVDAGLSTQRGEGEEEKRRHVRHIPSRIG